MNNRAILISLGFALVAVFFIQSYIESIEGEFKKKYDVEMNVLVAKRNLKEMETINETVIETKIIPKRFVEPSSIAFPIGKNDEENSKTNAEKEKQIKRLVGSVAIVPIQKGEQISFNKLTEPSMRTGLSPQVSPGKRGMSINVNEVSGVSKLIKPGDRVDLLAIVNLGDRKDTRMAKTILQDVVILAVGRFVTNNVARQVEFDSQSGKEKVKSLTDFEGFNTVTIEVEPAQAQIVTLLNSAAEGGVILSLRNNDDTERVPLQGTTLPEILGADLFKMTRAPSGQPSGLSGGAR